ncbi:hypothetical protein BDR04DRAFT_1177093, partial [Suillus decipiens]
AVLVELPWYMELNAIWHSNPSMVAKTCSSKPGIDHAGAFYLLVQPHGAGPSAGAHNTSPPTTQPPGVPSAVHLYGDPPINPQLHAPAPPSPPGKNLPPTHLHGLCNSPDVKIEDNFTPSNDNASGPFTAPLGDTLDHLDDDDDNDIMYDGTGTLNSPPRVAGKKWQFATSPSPPPDALQPFEMPVKTPTSFYDSRSTFGAQWPLSRGGDASYHQTWHAAYYHVSPTPQTSLLPNSAAGSKKKAKSDILQQVDLVQDETKSLQSSTMSLHENKHQCFLAKLEAKSEHQCDMKKYDWLRATCEHESNQAILSHKHQREDRDSKIHLCKVNIRVHEAHSLVLDKEAETLQLKIQFQQMMQGNRDLASDL